MVNKRDVISENDINDSEFDDDIQMPEGEPNNLDSEDLSSEDSDGIVMPEGPPPWRVPVAPKSMLQPLPGQPPLPLGSPPMSQVTNAYVPPPPIHHYHPQHRAGQYQPPQGQNNNQQNFGPPNPRQSRTSQVTVQSLPPLPGPPPSKPSAVISAEPILRDLKKESTTFVPNAIRKKQAAEKARANKSGLPNIVNAAPGASATMNNGVNRNDLMNSLQSHLDQREGLNPSNSSVVHKQKDEYQEFLGDIQDLL